MNGINMPITKISLALICVIFFCNNSKSESLKAAINQLERTELAVVANVVKTKESNLKIHVTKVLQGDEFFQNKIINIPKCIKSKSNTPEKFFNRKKTKKVALLFRKEWIDMPCRAILDIYDINQLPDVKILLFYKSIKNERKRLKFVLNLIPTDIYAVKKLVFDEFKEMKNPDNFYLFNKLIHKNTDCQDKKDALNIMVRTYDVRSVNYLIKLLSEENCEMDFYSAIALRNTFAGADGVAKAFTKLIDHPKIKRVVKKYLSDRYSNPSYIPEYKAPSRFNQAIQLSKKGDHLAATELFLSYLDFVSDSPCYQKYSSEILGIERSLPYLDEQQLERVYVYISSIDLDDEEVHFKIRGVMTDVLQQYPREGNLPLLLSLLEKSFRDGPTFKKIILILNKMKDEEKNQALELLRRKYHEGKSPQWVILIGMYWMGDYSFIDDVLKSHRQEIGSKNRLYQLTAREVKAMLALRSIAGDVSEIAFLKEAVKNPYIIAEWNLFSLLLESLIETNEPITADLLYEILELDFKKTSRTISQAMVKINTEQMHQMAIEMMRSEKQEYRVFATRTLYEFKLPQSLSYMRDAYKINGYGDQVEAAYRLGLIGEVKDIALLRTTCDYWKQPRKLSSKSCRAINFLNSKHHYDLNGPIIKTLKKTPFE